MNITRISLDYSSISLYNLTGGGKFTGLGVNSAIVYFYNTKPFFNDFRWDNGTIISLNATDINVNVSIGRYITIGSYYPPNISLISPLNLEEDTDGIVDFSFNVSDSSSVSNCSLYLNNVLEQTDALITKDILQSFHVINVKQSNNLNFFVTCTDELNNKGNSSIFRMDTKPEDSDNLIGGGGGSYGGVQDAEGVLKDIKILGLNSTICEYVYSYLLKYGFDDYPQLILNLNKSKINISSDILKEKYILKFQGGCSDIINKTLNPQYVCNSIRDFKKSYKTNFTEEDVMWLRENITGTLPITYNLLNYYIKNFGFCDDYQEDISLISNNSQIYLYTLASLIISGLIILSFKKSILAMLKLKEK